MAGYDIYRAFGGITFGEAATHIPGYWSDSDIDSVEKWYRSWGPSGLIKDVGLTPERDQLLKIIANKLYARHSYVGEELLGWVAAYLVIDRSVKIMAGGNKMANWTMSEISNYMVRFNDWQDALDAAGWLPMQHNGNSSAKNLDDLGKLRSHYRGNDTLHMLFGSGVSYESIVAIADYGFTKEQLAPYVLALAARVDPDVVAGAIRSGENIDLDLLSQV